MLSLYLACTSPSLLSLVDANPSSKPYIPFRTDPFDQDTHHKLDIPPDRRISNVRRFSAIAAVSDKACPLQFSLGISRRAHVPPLANNRRIVEPPTIYPVHPSYGPGRQVIHTTQYEHLDMLSPQQIFDTNSIIKEGLQQQPDFPLLMESSSFLGAPLILDANGDGILDAALVDYDGGIYIIGLKVGKDQTRYFHKAQIPRLYIRRNWVEARLNQTLPKEEKNNQTVIDVPGHKYTSSNDPYHSYFEYGTKIVQDAVLRGVTANLMGQDTKDLKGLDERRQRKVNQSRPEQQELPKQLEPLQEHVEATHRRLQEIVPDTPHEIINDLTKEVVTDGNEALVHHDAVTEILHEDHLDTESKVITKVEHDGAREGGPNNVNDTRQEKGEGKVIESGEVPVNHSQRNIEQDDIAHQDSEDAQWEGDRAGEGTDWGDDDFSGEGKSAKGTDDESNDQNEHDGEAIKNENEEQKAGEETESQKKSKGSSGDDYSSRYRNHGYDDYYAGRYGSTHEDFYDEKHYIRLPPHVLSTPVLAELQKLYSNDKEEKEEMLLIAVSYYMDEDEYEGLFSYKRFEAIDRGDETEINRGMYVGSALVIYTLDGSNHRFGRQEHLDLSGDASSPQNHTLVGQVPIRVDESKLGAFALSSPTVADIDGNGDEDVLMGTSMGMIYCFHARHLYNSDGWPIQVGHAVESRILVEDTMGDTSLEVYVNDVGGNIYCFNHKAVLLWRRNLLQSVTGGAELRGSSTMSMGDVDGDGKLDIVMTIKTLNPRGEWSTYIIAVSAITGDDLDSFPIEFDSPLPLDDGMGDALLHQKLPQPLLVDLHADQSHWKAYLSRNGTDWQHPKKTNSEKGAPHGGIAAGLHIAQPIGSNLYIVEAGSGCTHVVAIGEEVAAMVQSDDVHGTNNLDLVVSTTSGNIITLESPVVPYHPLNVWNTGEIRSRRNNFAQGFTASQGIFVRDVSRRYRDVFGIYIPITIEIFDNRPNIAQEPDKRVYKVDIRDGTSPKRSLFRKVYVLPGVYTERIYVSFGPGFYTLSVLLKTTHGIYYEDTFHLGYNVHFMDGFGLLLYIPLFLAAVPILLCSKKKADWNDDDFGDDERDGKGLGILGRS